jgi:hypothetical protein
MKKGFVEVPINLSRCGVWTGTLAVCGLRRFGDFPPKSPVSVDDLLEWKRLQNDICVSSMKFRANKVLEQLRFRDEWTKNITKCIHDRLLHPRFTFPGVYDRAPPPPKTLHWRYAPKEGEYTKMRAMLSWASLHIWLLSGRLSDTEYNFLIDRCYEYLYNELTAVWLPEASIPAFSIKGEAKMLVDECRVFVSQLASTTDPSALQDTIFSHSISHCGLGESDPILTDLISYLVTQKKFLECMSRGDIVDTQWQWVD